MEGLVVKLIIYETLGVWILVDRGECLVHEDPSSSWKYCTPRGINGDTSVRS